MQSQSETEKKNNAVSQAFRQRENSLFLHFFLVLFGPSTDQHPPMLERGQSTLLSPLIKILMASRNTLTDTSISQSYGTPGTYGSSQAGD